MIFKIATRIYNIIIMMKHSRMTFWFSKFPWARQRKSPNIRDSLRTRSQKRPSAVPEIILTSLTQFVQVKETEARIYCVRATCPPSSSLIWSQQWHLTKGTNYKAPHCTGIVAKLLIQVFTCITELHPRYENVLLLIDTDGDGQRRLNSSTINQAIIWAPVLSLYWQFRNSLFRKCSGRRSTIWALFQED